MSNDYNLAHRADPYGTGGGIAGYGGRGPHANSEAAHLARFAQAIGLLEDDDQDAPLASGLRPVACRPLWLCPSCGWSPSDDGRVVGGRPTGCAKCGCVAMEPVGPDPSPVPPEPAPEPRADRQPNLSARWLTDTQKDRIVRLARTTLLLDCEIGDRIGCSKDTVRRWRERAGIACARVRGQKNRGRR